MKKLFSNKKKQDTGVKEVPRKAMKGYVAVKATTQMWISW